MIPLFCPDNDVTTPRDCAGTECGCCGTRLTMRAGSVLATFFLFAVLFARAECTPLEHGFHQMYDLQFEGAHRTFHEWEQAHPEDPMGPVSDAAAYLFSEFDRLHILETEFFTHDDHFFADSRRLADSGVKQKFQAALGRTGELAARALARNPRDEKALFASVLRMGLDSDYQALIEKRYRASFSKMKSGRLLAQQLLAIDPQRYDAYLAIGVENYVLSLKPAPLRLLLRLAGAQTDRNEGLRQLKLTADNGHYLQPLARLLLAVAALRDKDENQAKRLLASLCAEYSHNRLFREELVRLR